MNESLFSNVFTQITLKNEKPRKGDQEIVERSKQTYLKITWRFFSDYVKNHGKEGKVITVGDFQLK